VVVLVAVRFLILHRLTAGTISRRSAPIACVRQ